MISIILIRILSVYIQPVQELKKKLQAGCGVFPSVRYEEILYAADPDNDWD